MDKKNPFLARRKTTLWACVFILLFVVVLVQTKVIRVFPNKSSKESNSSDSTYSGLASSEQSTVKKECNEIPFKHEGYQHAKWVLVDYVNIVVHILQPETRKFYKLEDLWSDGQLTEHDEEKPKAGSRNPI